MSKKIRDYLFIIFIILFILGTIFVSLYASGFQINFSGPLNFNRLLIRTGIITIKTKPEGATIYLNNKPQSNFSINPWKNKHLLTNTMIKNVLPGKYDLNLQLKGYLPFTKRITVYSGQTTFIEHINLFRDNLPQLIATSSKSELELSPSYKYLYLKSPAKVITIATGRSKNIESLSNAKGTWSNKDELFTKGYLFNPLTNKTINYQKILGKNTNNFYYDENENRLYYQNGNTLNYLELNKKSSTLIIKGEDYLTYKPLANNLFLVAIKNGKTLLQSYSLKNHKFSQETSLPKIGHYFFIPNNYSYLTLYDKQNKTLYLIDPNNINNKKIINNVISWQWRDKQTLLYNNDWEIYQLNIPENNNILLTRVGKKIDKIIWNKNNKYLIFSTNNSIDIYDPQANIITKIFKTKQITSITLDPDKNILYFWGEIGRQSGVYNIFLQ